MSGAEFLALSSEIALLAIAVVLLLSLRLVVRSPTLPDRFVAVDMLGYLVVAFSAALVLSTRVAAFLDAAACLALVSFLSTIAFARYLRSAPPPSREGEDK